MIYIGIDPGAKGFISYSSDDEIESIQMPLNGTSVDLKTLFEIFLSLSVFNHKCIIEDVHAIYGSAAGATFSFGYTIGGTHALLEASGIGYELVQPKMWQKEMWAGIEIQKKPSKSGSRIVTDTKATSILAAKTLFPHIDLRANSRCKIDHDGKADSLLLMEYCKKKHK